MDYRIKELQFQTNERIVFNGLRIAIYLCCILLNAQETYTVFNYQPPKIHIAFGDRSLKQRDVAKFHRNFYE